MIEKHSKTFVYRIYEGAGHGYMRTGDDPNGLVENITARNESWEWIKEILSRIES